MRTCCWNTLTLENDDEMKEEEEEEKDRPLSETRCAGFLAVERFRLDLFDWITAAHRWRGESPCDVIRSSDDRPEFAGILLVSHFVTARI